jgi:E3 SUMO-protein ligase PIAS1
MSPTLTFNSPKYQLRLYCTSATYYTPSSYRANQELCLVEFPPTCEVRVNGTTLSANVKGLKKKPGTAPPADLGKAVKTNGQNSVEMVYVNSAQNTPGKVRIA